jgi:hypothetical protein
MSVRGRCSRPVARTGTDTVRAARLTWSDRALLSHSDPVTAGSASSRAVVEAGEVDQLHLGAGASFGDQVEGEALAGEQEKLRLADQYVSW